MFITNDKNNRTQYKYAVFSTLLFGLVSHGMGLFNKYSNHDDLHYFFTGGVTFISGRWMLYWIERLEKLFAGTGLFSLPVFNGFIVIFCIAVSLCLLIDLFNIRSNAFCIMLSGIMVSIPVITCMFGYMFTAHYFGISLLAAVTGAYLILKYDKWYTYAAGILLLTCSAGIYQGFIPTIVSVFLLRMIREAYESGDPSRQKFLLKKTAIALVSGILFIGLYIFLMNFFLKRYGLELNDYKGMNSYTEVSFSKYLDRIVFAFREFFALSHMDTFYDINLRPGLVRHLYIFSLVMFFPFYGILVFSKRKQIFTVIYMLVCLALIPLAVNFIFIMTDPQDCYAMMLYGKAIFYLFFVWCLENGSKLLSGKWSRAAGSIAVLILGLIVTAYWRFDNACYLRMDLIQTQTFRFFTTLVTRIQSTEGYQSYDYVSYIDYPNPDFFDNTVVELTEFDSIRIPPYFNFNNTVKDPVWKEFLRIWCNFSPHEIDQSYFVDLPEVKAMPHYPNDGSIRIIDGTVVVKF